MNSFFATQPDPHYDPSELFPGANKKLEEMRKARVKAEAVKAEAAEQARREKIIQSAINAVFKQQEKTRRDEEQAHLKEAAERARLEAFTCRRCSVKFASNTKLHEHVREHHTKKSASPTLSLSSINSIETPPSAPPTKQAPTPKAAPTSKAAPTPKAAPIPKAASSPKPASPLTPPATPPITWAAVASKPACKATCTSPLTPPSTPTPMASKPATNYLTMNDLFRMFHSKPPPPGIREKSTTLPYKPTPFSKAFPEVHRYIKELELALEKICFRFASDSDRGKSLRYASNSTRPPCNSSRLPSRPQQPWGHGFFF